MHGLMDGAAHTEMPCRSSLPFAYNRNGRESNNHDKLDGAVLALILNYKPLILAWLFPPFLPEKQTVVTVTSVTVDARTRHHTSTHNMHLSHTHLCGLPDLETSLAGFDKLGPLVDPIETLT